MSKIGISSQTPRVRSVTVAAGDRAQLTEWDPNRSGLLFQATSAAAVYLGSNRVTDHAETIPGDPGLKIDASGEWPAEESNAGSEWWAYAPAGGDAATVIIVEEYPR